MSSKKDSLGEDLVGFQDFIDGQSDIRKKSKPRESLNSFDMISFLGKESKRLDTMSMFLEEKVISLKNFPQHEYLIKQEEKRLTDIKERLLEELCDADSIISKNITDLLMTHFNH